MTTVVSIHQPNYLPWLGYFHKMTYSDMFVFLDAFQYSPHTYINRSYVRQGKERVRLSVPVRTERWDGPINEVRFDTRRFARKHLAIMRFAYQKSPWFDEIMALLEPHYAVGETNLADFNIGLITSLTAYLSLSLRFFRMSELGISAAGNQTSHRRHTSLRRRHLRFGNRCEVIYRRTRAMLRASRTLARLSALHASGVPAYEVAVPAGKQQR